MKFRSICEVRYAKCEVRSAKYEDGSEGDGEGGGNDKGDGDVDVCDVLVDSAILYRTECHCNTPRTIDLSSKIDRMKGELEFEVARIQRGSELLGRTSEEQGEALF